MLKTIAISAVVSAVVSYLVVWADDKFTAYQNETLYSPLCEEQGGYLFVDAAGGGRCISREVFLNKPKD